MITSLNANDSICFHDIGEKRIAKQVLEKETLQLKMEEFRAKMALMCQKTDKMFQQQTTLHQVALQVASTQDEVRFSLGSLRKRVENIDQAAKKISEAQEATRMKATSLTDHFSNLTQVAVHIEQSQRNVAAVLENAVQHKIDIQQQVNRIQSNEEAIQQNLKLAVKKVEKIEQQIQEIEKDQESIKIKKVEIEENNIQLQAQAKQIEEIVNQSQHRLRASIAKMKAHSTLLWSGILSRMNVLCSWLFLEVGGIFKQGKKEIHHLLSSYQWINVNITSKISFFRYVKHILP